MPPFMPLDPDEARGRASVAGAEAPSSARSSEQRQRARPSSSADAADAEALRSATPVEQAKTEALTTARQWKGRHGSNS